MDFDCGRNAQFLNSKTINSGRIIGMVLVVAVMLILKYLPLIGSVKSEAVQLSQTCA